MATKKITVTLPVDQVQAVQAAVASGGADSVSAFVAHAVSVALDDVAGWSVMLDQALVASGGDLSADELRWADDVLLGRTPRAGAAA